MTNLEKYNLSFIQAFNIKKDILSKLEYGSIQEWQSLGHMILISEVEKNFEIEFDPEDITKFNSYKNGKIILEKYNIILN